MGPFVVDIYSSRCAGSVKKTRRNTDSFETALSLMESMNLSPDVNRIVISRRLGGTDEVSKMKVWTRNLAA